MTTRKRKAQEPPKLDAMGIVMRCLSIEKAVTALRIARKRLRVSDAKSAWVSEGAKEIDAQLARHTASLIADMRALWPEAADELEAWLATDQPLPPHLVPPYPAPRRGKP